MTDLSKFVKKLDLFRRIDDGYLSSATSHGGTCSLLAYIVMVALAIFEYSDYMSSHTTTTVVMDVNRDKSILIRFSITMLDLPCNYAVVDVYDTFGFDRQNVTKDITKTRLHLVDGKLQVGEIHVEVDTEVSTPSDQAKEIELDEEGHHALDLLGLDGFKAELQSHDYTLMNFYAPWCHWCKELAPTYEKAADEFDQIQFPHKIRAKFASLNCEKYGETCKDYKVRAYPTLLIFNKDKPLYPHYSGERTVNALIDYLKKAVLEAETHMPNTYHDQACRIEGFINVPRVPGNFHMEARSSTQDMSPSMANLSHIVNHLMFGRTLARALEKKLPIKHRFLIHPLNGRSFILDKIHTAPQHYINVVSTIYEFSNWNLIKSYQLTTQNRISTYAEDEIPQAKFSYELSPVSVIVSQRGKPFYKFLTSLFAIIGGTFTVISLLDGAVGSVNARLKRSIGKLK